MAQAVLDDLKKNLNQLTDLEKQRQEQDEAKKLWEEEKSKVASIHFSSPIKLDVGGHQSKTSLKTLQREESVLSCMFSPGSRILVEKDKVGYYFIDRPGMYFAPILHYLQTGDLLPIKSKKKREAIAIEADFYQVLFATRACAREKKMHMYFFLCSTFLPPTHMHTLLHSLLFFLVSIISSLPFFSVFRFFVQFKSS